MNTTLSDKPQNISLQFWTCFFLDSENGEYPCLENSTLQIMCKSQGKYLLGQELGSVVFTMIVSLIHILGLAGLVTNILNVIILRKSLKGLSSVATILITLAIFDFCLSLTSMILSAIILVIQENINRSESIFIFVKTFLFLHGFARTGAIYITILVTIERYIVIAFPIKSKQWLSPVKSTICLIFVITLAFLLEISWLLNSSVVNNPYISQAPNTTLAEFPYIMKATKFTAVVYPIIKYVLLALCFVAPFPLLLIFNFLLYKSIHTWNKKTLTINKTHRTEVNVAKMLLIVVAMLLICHTVSCIVVFTAQLLKVTYRELLMLRIFSGAFESASNFFIYYIFGKAFRNEFKCLWSLFFDKLEAPYSSSQNTN